MTDTPLVILLEPEGAYRCNADSCDWIDTAPLVHAREVHGLSDEADVLIVDSEDA